MQNKRTKRKEYTGIIESHIKNNFKNYVIITIIFLVGIIFGVLFINNANQTKSEEISGYINEFIKRTKEEASIDYIGLFFSSLKQNLFLAILLWFAGLTVIGVFVVYGVVAYKGFCLRL